jgi:hypothetical protein
MPRRPKYRIGDEPVDRKHLWLPCVMNDQLDDATDEEKARLLRATWWADNITNAEWPALLGQQGASKTAKSRLKRKTVGWLMAMGRIAALNPDLFDAAVREARDLYATQLRQEHPLMVKVNGGEHAGDYLIYRFEVARESEPLTEPTSTSD